MKGGFSLIVFSVMIAIGLYRYMHTLPSQRTDLSKKYFLRFIIGTISITLGILLFGIADALITVSLVLFGFYFALFNGMSLFAGNPNKNNNQIKNIPTEPIKNKPQEAIPKVTQKPVISKENFDKPTYTGNVRCNKCGHIDRAASFSASILGDGYRKCHICNEDFQFMSRYVGSTTYIGNYRCNICHHQDEEKKFLSSSAGNKFRQCHMCGGHFQIN